MSSLLLPLASHGHFWPVIAICLLFTTACYIDIRCDFGPKVTRLWQKCGVGIWGLASAYIYGLAQFDLWYCAGCSIPYATLVGSVFKWTYLPIVALILAWFFFGAWLWVGILRDKGDTVGQAPKN